MPENDEHVCFFISPIGEPGSQVREDADQVLIHIVQPAVEPLGYDVVRADMISEPGMITTQIVERVMESPLVIADLTGDNPNVFYELAIRHATGLPCILIGKTGQRIPFDITTVRVVHYDLSLDGVKKAIANIAEQVQSCMKRTWTSEPRTVDNPITMAVSMQAFRTMEPYGGVNIVLDALLQDETEPGYLQMLHQKAEGLFRVLCDADERKQKRLSKEMDTLARIGEMVREVEKARIEGRMPFYARNQSMP